MGLYVGNTKYKVMSGSNKASLLSPNAYDSRIEYIKSTGTQYINTGFIPNQDSRLVIEVIIPTLSTGACTFGGSFNGAWRPGFGVYGGNSTYQMSSVYDDSDVQGGTSYKYTANDKYEVDLNKNVYSVKRNGTTVYTYTHPTSNFTLQTAIELFRINIATPRYGKFILYSAKIYDNGVLVRNLIPVRKGSVGYMYDTISGLLFGNSGTGNFVLGLDKPIYDAEVEYLQSSGTQYIDTGLFGDMDLDFECVAQVDDNDNYYNILGDRESVTSRRYSLMAAISTQPYGGYVNCGNNNQIYFSDTYTTMVYRTYKKFGLNVYIDDNLIDTFLQQTFTTPNTIILFGCRNNGSPSSMMNGKICSCKLSKNGVLQRNYIPVRIGTTGYMYDTISHKLFGNAGTGQFIIGPDK